MSKMPVHLATVLWDCLVTLQFADVAAAHAAAAPYDGTVAPAAGNLSQSTSLLHATIYTQLYVKHVNTKLWAGA
jgi:hypothetical protein